ncbi:hypothetical protein SISSUDRAFT_447516 [Sistotremastrum suecicum HHB10207 ss-3]|uniref:Uncharacterized protein n=1 Tax=Sistotremastrum suecicum HHB10207 ss-3 TaxID=1314776 RepID=A0A166FGQ3_9AGAM|nr:hypothetical protein SISSUDRAFT_447516 [Sistotremastrum suecicum HHB10207 ss-3]
MDPAYMDKKIVDLSEDELIMLGFVGDDVHPEVVDMVKTTASNADTQSNLHKTLLRRHPYTTLQITPSSLPPSYPNTSRHSIIPVYPPTHLRSSGVPTTLPILTQPHPPKAHFWKIPSKTIHSVSRTRLNTVWGEVAPKIVQLIKGRGIKYSAMMLVRFSIFECGEEGEAEKEDYLGPVVVWIAVRPDTADAVALRDATPDILDILAEAQITVVVIGWYEGSVERMVDCK